MDPTIIDLLTAGDDNDLRAKAQILAKQLRGQGDIGIAAQAGPKTTREFGRGLVADADVGERQMLAAGIANQRTGQYAQDRKVQMADLSAQRAFALQRMKGDQAHELAQMKLAAGAGAKPKALGYGEVKDVQRLNTELGSLDDLDGRFKDTFAGKGPLGAYIVKAKKALGSSASPAQQEEAAYWADYQRLVDIPQRHEKFGSALTPGESRIWESARNLGPTSDPKIVRATIASMKGILSRHLDAWKESRMEAGYSEKQLAPLIKSSGGAAPAGTRKFTRVNGKLVEVK